MFSLLFESGIRVLSWPGGARPAPAYGIRLAIGGGPDPETGSIIGFGAELEWRSGICLLDLWQLRLAERHILERANLQWILVIAESVGSSLICLTKSVLV